MQRIYSLSIIKAKLVDFSKVAVSSPVVDVSYFLYSSVHPLLISEHYVALLQVSFNSSKFEWWMTLRYCKTFWRPINKMLFQAYHHAHLEAIKGFGMHGYEMDFEILVQEYQVRNGSLVNSYSSKWWRGFSPIVSHLIHWNLCLLRHFLETHRHHSLGWEGYYALHCTTR